MTTIEKTHYYIDEYNSICKQYKGMDDSYAEVMNVMKLIEDINELIDENELLKEHFDVLFQMLLDKGMTEEEILDEIFGEDEE